MTSPADLASVRATEEDGRRYRAGVYDPIDEQTLEDAPNDSRFPAPGNGPAFKRAPRVPRVPRVRHLVGPSVIAAGMGLGAGEFLLWPNLITVNGYGIWWLFWIGVLTQFIVVGEIERWTIATGESVFGGMARIGRFAVWPWFFLIATLFSFFWPGWASLSGEFVGEIVFLVTDVQLAWQPLALVMLAFIWVGLALSKVVYNALERFEITLVLAFFPLLLTTLLIVGIVPSDFLDLLKGAASVGIAPPELLTGDQFPTLLLAVAYAGTGGTLLLAQSLWIRDKGFGMAVHQGRIAGIRGTNEDVSETGFVFDAEDKTSLARFQAWMKAAHKELLATFVLLTLVSVVITCLLVTSTLGVGNLDLAGDQAVMVLREGEVIQQVGGVWLRVAFLLGGSFILFSTQIGIIDTVTRISGSIFYERYGRRTAFWTQKRTFLLFLSLLTVAAMGIVTASWLGGQGLAALEPTFLLLVAGPFTITSMYAYTLVIGYMNMSRLPAALASPLWKRWGMLWAATLWGWFTVEVIARAVMDGIGVDVATVESLTWHPVRIACYAFWLGSLVWFGARVVPRKGRD